MPKENQKHKFISEKVTTYPYYSKNKKTDEKFVSFDIYEEEKFLRKQQCEEYEKKIEETNEAFLQNINRLQEVIDERNNLINSLTEEIKFFENFYGPSFQYARFAYQNQQQQQVDSFDNYQEEFVDDIYLDPKVPISTGENIDDDEFNYSEYLEDFSDTSFFNDDFELFD